MALNNVWEDKQDGIDDILSNDINDIAHAVIEDEKGIEELKERVDGINVALKNVAAKYELVGVDIKTVTDSGIYSIGSDCTGLPVDLGQAWCGKTLIVSANTAGDYYNQYLIANWYADENGDMTEYTRIYACYIYNPSGTPSYDMPWTLIYDTSKPQLMLDATLSEDGAAADAKAVGDALLEKLSVTYLFEPCDIRKIEKTGIYDYFSYEFQGQPPGFETGSYSVTLFVDVKKDDVSGGRTSNLILFSGDQGNTIWQSRWHISDDGIVEVIRDWVCLANEDWGTELREKAEKVNILNIGAENDESLSVTMQTNTESRVNELYTGSIEIVVPDEMEDDYISSLVFESSSPARTLTYPASIQMTGTDCIEGVFVPAENKRYTLYLEYDGKYVSGFVSGVSTV